MIQTLYEVDAALALWVNGWQGSSVLDAVFVYGTWLGTWLGAVGVTIAYFVRNPRGARRLVPALAVATFGGLINGALKWYVARPRPPQDLGEIRVLGPMLWGHSFPSGHTTLAFIVLGLVWHLDRRLGWAWLPCAIFVGLSRVYLGVHYPSDVAAGAMIGFLPTYFLLRRFQRTDAV